MANQIQRRRGTTLEHQSFTGAIAELTIDTDKNTGVIHDGITPGGHPLLREDLANLQGLVSAGRGGTGLDHVPTNAVLIGNGTLPMVAAVPNSPNQVLSFDGNSIRWSHSTSGGGNISSVAGKTGVVTLEPADIIGLGAMATRTKIDWNTDISNKPATFPSASSVSSVAGKQGAVTLSVQDVSGVAALNSPAFTGVPRAPTPNPSDNSTAIATTAWVKTALSQFTPADTGPVASVSADEFIGNGTTTAFTLSGPPGSTKNSWVTVSGLLQSKNTYSIFGNSLIFSEAPPSGAAIECMYIVSTGSLTVNADDFTGNGSTTTFALSYSPGSTSNSWVSVSGVSESKLTYAIAGSNLVFSEAPPNGVAIECMYLTSAGSVTPVADEFTGNGSSIAFTLSNAPGSTSNSWVSVSGLSQSKLTYSITGTSLTFSEAPPADSAIECTYLTGLTASGGTTPSSTPLLALAVTGGTASSMNVSGVSGGSTTYYSGNITISVTNNGTVTSAAVIFTLSNTTNFEVTGGTITSGVTTLAAGASGTITVRAKATGSGTYSGNLQVTSDNAPNAISLSGTATFSATARPYVLTSNSGDILTSSDNGVTWTLRNSGTTGPAYNIRYVNNKFYAITAASLISSTDGITWTVQTLPVNVAGFNSFCFGNGKFVANVSRSYGGFTDFATSTDGITWTVQSQNTNYGNKIATIGFDGTYYYAAGAGTGGVVIRSSDGLNWSNFSDLQALALSNMGSGFTGVSPTAFYEVPSTSTVPNPLNVKIWIGTTRNDVIGYITSSGTAGVMAGGGSGNTTSTFTATPTQIIATANGTSGTCRTTTGNSWSLLNATNPPSPPGVYLWCGDKCVLAGTPGGGAMNISTTTDFVNWTDRTPSSISALMNIFREGI